MNLINCWFKINRKVQQQKILSGKAALKLQQNG